MKFAIVLAAICFLGVAFAAPTPASDAAAKPNAFADWQKAFQETLNNLLGGNKDKPKRELTWADFDGLKELKGYKGKRDLTADILTAVMNMNNPIVLAQTMFKIMNQLNAMGQNKPADGSAPAPAADNAGAGNLAGDAIALLTKTNDPMAFAGQLFKIVNTLAKDNKVVLPAGAAKPKFNFLKNPVLKNPNWNKKPATEAEVVEEVVEEVAVEDSTEAAIERVARQERLPEWEPDFKDQMKANAYGIIGVGNLLEYLDERKAKKAAAAKAAGKTKRETAAAPEKKLSTNVFADAAVAMQNAFQQAMDNAFKQINTDGAVKAKFNFLKNPTLKNPNWNKKPAAETEVVEEVVVEDSTEATRVAREAEAVPAPAGQFSLKDFGKMVDDFYAQFQAPKKSA